MSQMTVQAWKDITMRIAAALKELEKQSPPNWVQIEGHGSPKAIPDSQAPVEGHPAL